MRKHPFIGACIAACIPGIIGFTIKNWKIPVEINIDIARNDILLFLAIFLAWFSIAWTIKNPSWIRVLYGEITGKAKRERERIKREKETEEKLKNWKLLIHEMGYHYGAARRLLNEGRTYRHEDFKLQRNFVIGQLHQFEFVVPAQEEMFQNDFEELWVNFLEAFKDEVHPYYQSKIPTDQRILDLWTHTIAVAGMHDNM